MTTDPKRPKQGPKTEIDPALDAVLDGPITGADRSHTSDEEKLDTGMKVGVAIRRASFWWDRTGRGLMKDRNSARDNRAFGFFNPNPKTKAEAMNWLPSGIMAGDFWDNLTRAEKLQITKLWHHHHVRVPSIEPTDMMI